MPDPIVLNGTPESAQEITDSIIKISQAMEVLLNSGLSKRALLVLLNDYSGVPKREISHVLEGLEQLRNEYCTK